MRLLSWFFALVALLGSSGLSAAEKATVAVVAGDTPGLVHPCSRDSVPSDAAVEEMVRQAMELGGIRQVLKPDARHVLLKPCIVVAGTDHWRNTEPRTVRAVALVVHDIAPKARITIGEGPGAWMAQARPEVKHWELNIADGFETEGFRAALADPRLKDAQVEFVDLNFADCRLVKVPGGGWARDAYWIPAAVLDADVSITIPRLKTAMPEIGGITVAMKNQIGVAPGMKYGWPKKSGYPSGSGNPGIPHTNEILGETITDLNLCAGMDFAVAESFRRPIDQAWERDSAWIGGVVAGADLVAVDAVSAYLMGFNPEEVETVVEGERRGLGVGRFEAIDLRGEKDLDRLRRGFPGMSGAGTGMGMGNRIWIVSGPHPRTEEGMKAVDPSRPMQPGKQGFGEPVWFHDDKCDLGQLLGKPAEGVAFAYCEFEAPQAGPARLQVASDEGMTAWLNGVEVYRFEGWRRIDRPNAMVPIQVKEGVNRLLCRLEQTSRQFLFSANVVTAEPSPLNGRFFRPAGLRFHAPGSGDMREVLAQDTGSGDQWVARGWWREVAVDQTRPDSIAMEGMVAELLQARSFGVVSSRSFGDLLRARAQVRGEDVLITTSGAAVLWADLGRLRGQGQPARVSVVENTLRWQGRRWFRGQVKEVPRDTSVVWSGQVPDTPILLLGRPDPAKPWSVGWAATPPPAESAEVVVGQTTGVLGSNLYTLGWAQSSGGVLLADAYREGTGADLAIALAREVGDTLSAGPVARGDLLDLVRAWGGHLATWTLTGAQLDSLFEQWVSQERGDARSSPQLSGFTAQVDLSRPKGDRVSLSLQPDRTYRVAGLSLFRPGEGPPRTELLLSPVQAAENYLARHRPYSPVAAPRLAISGTAAD